MRHKLHYVAPNTPSNPLYVMVLDDIRELVNSESYRYLYFNYYRYKYSWPVHTRKLFSIVSCMFFRRNNPNLHLHELKGFEAPDFMLKKIRSSVINSFVDFANTEECSSQYDVKTIQIKSPSVNSCSSGEINTSTSNVNNQVKIHTPIK